MTGCHREGRGPGPDKSGPYVVTTFRPDRSGPYVVTTFHPDKSGPYVVTTFRTRQRGSPQTRRRQEMERTGVSPCDPRSMRRRFASRCQDGSELTGGEWSPSAIAISANGFVLAFDSPIDSLVVYMRALSPAHEHVSSTVRHVVPPRSRRTIWVNEEALPRGFGPGLVYLFRGGPAKDLSVRIRSVNDVPVIAERAMWWPGEAGGWYEAHNSSGSTITASRWVLAEEESGGPLDWDTFVRSFETMARHRCRWRRLKAHGITAGRAGVLVESVGAPLPLVVERAMYRLGGRSGVPRGDQPSRR